MLRSEGHQRNAGGCLRSGCDSPDCRGPLSAHPSLPAPPLPLVSEHFLWCFTLRNAPPVVDVGMRVTTNVNNTNIVNNNSVHDNTVNNTTIKNTTNNITNVKNVTNITNVTIVAPPGANANGQAVNTSVPAQAHLAAAQPALFAARAPEPAGPPRRG